MGLVAYQNSDFCFFLGHPTADDNKNNDFGDMKVTMMVMMVTEMLR